MHGCYRWFMLTAFICLMIPACNRSGGDGAQADADTNEDTQSPHLPGQLTESAAAAGSRIPATLASAALKSPGLSPERTRPINDSSVPGVAVIDLNRLAEKLGRLDAFQARLDQRRQELRSNLELLKTGYQEELDDLRQRLGDSPTANQLAELETRAVQRDQSLLEADRQAVTKIAQFEEQIKREFMNEVRPVAFQVAEEYGFGVVLTVPQVFAFRVGSEVDITERVAQRIRLFSSTQNESLPDLSSPDIRGSNE